MMSNGYFSFDMTFILSTNRFFRTRAGGERRPDDSSSNKAPSNESWRTRTKPDQQYRDDRRGHPSQQTQASPSSTSERWPERSSETSSSWRTVEKKRPNP
jgi:hypothetical protein